VLRLVAVAAALALVGCADPLTADATCAYAWQVKNVEGYGRTVAGEPPDVVYGWGLVVEGDTATWRACAAVDACGSEERARPKEDVRAVERVGVAHVEDGGVVQVLKLTLAPGKKYIVPYTNPANAALR
jgi:hypothetical protein